MDKNVLVLAYLGDSIYETYIREFLISTGISKINQLQSESIKYVSARGQALFLKELLENNMLYDDEIDIVMRARNHKNNHKPKNCDVITYRYATALEALIGYLYFENRNSRIKEIINYIIRR